MRQPKAEASSPLQEGVTFAFRADGSFRAVARQYACFIGQCEQAVVDRFDDLAVIAPGQIGAANTAGKYRIAGDHHLQRREVQADGALRMARRVNDLGWILREADGEPLGERFVRRRSFGGVHAQPRCLNCHHLQQRQIALVEENRRASEAFELQRAAHMIDVSMRDENLCELEAEVDKATMNPRHVIPRINDDGFAGFFIAQDRAVARQRTHGRSFKDHGFELKADRQAGWRYLPGFAGAEIGAVFVPCSTERMLVERS